MFEDAARYSTIVSITSLVWTFALLGGGCATQRAAQSKSMASAAAGAPTSQSAAAASSDAKQKGTSNSSSSDSDSLQRDIVKEARLSLDVDDTRKTIDTLAKLAKRYSGYVVRSSDDEIAMRVEAARLEEAIDAITNLARVEEVIEKNVWRKDVTGTVRDYEIRLESKREARARYLTLMKKAQKVEDMLKIEKELERINEEIEVLQGKLKRMRERVSFSKITIRVQREAEGDAFEGNISYFSPGVEYAVFGLQGMENSIRLHGPTLEFSLLSWRDLAAEEGPSHWQFYFSVGLLNRFEGDATPWATWSSGLQMSFESKPARQWLVPIFGLEVGQIFPASRDNGLAHVTPMTGVHLWSDERAVVSLEGHYVASPSEFESFRGWRVDVGARFTFW